MKPGGGRGAFTPYLQIQRTVLQVKYMILTHFLSQTMSKLTCKLVLLNRWKVFGNRWNLIEVQKLQSRAARIVTNSSYDSSASALIKTLNWPTVADITKVEKACMVYKSINDLAPDYLSEIFTKNSACSRKNLRNTATDLQVPLMKPAMVNELSHIVVLVSGTT